MPTRIYEDNECIVFDEIDNPQAPVHFVVVPKNRPKWSDATDEDTLLLGRLLLAAKSIALKKGLQSSGYHVVVDEDFRSHQFKGLHVFGRALHHMIWPVGPGGRL